MAEVEYSNARGLGRPEEVLAEARSRQAAFDQLTPEQKARKARLARMRADADARDRHLAEVATREGERT